MIEKICRNCKHYIPNEGKNWNTNYGSCISDKMIYGSSSDNEAKGNDKLFYMDYEWYSAGIEVGENFGCVHFEEKGAKE